VKIKAPKYGENFIDRFMRRIFGDQVVRIKLDGMGSLVWKLCDGETSLERIAAALEEKFPENTEKALERAELFLQTLHREGWISYLVPDRS